MASYQSFRGTFAVRAPPDIPKSYSGHFIKKIIIMGKVQSGRDGSCSCNFNLGGGGGGGGNNINAKDFFI